jgi:preprotein translocase subunit YajC
MELNWITISGLLIIVVIVVFFLIKRNYKDEKDYENFLNDNDLPIDKEEDEANNY